ncbi:bifunctional acetate--CoA ligase family protein/GNAT family N-acetyltransferase [Hugenholtzia roseola]|uniref:bifunctional acetate--CoA ligase family protein/GNAT family N-acetyltransferase n=1 Tax=Hugenholtzia roseola TaxID=1002 RepID=UPI000A32A3C9|nr:bifunctional acetate--CoA ligase family protein/GNAT family N-acetyltransferase [Hugenholtzia roseola]
MKTPPVISFREVLRCLYEKFSAEDTQTPPFSWQKLHLPYSRESIERLLQPQSIAVIGASEREGSIGREVFLNLTQKGFKGEVYPVNPKHRRVYEQKCYDEVSEIEELIDLAIIVTPAATVPQVVRECGQAGVKTVLIISAGFREIGQEGAELEARILFTARKYGVRILGTNSIGVIRPSLNLFATPSQHLPNSGNIGFITQSAALGDGILDWAKKANVGFSAFFSIGSMLDISLGELIFHLGDDPQTKAIVIYCETVTFARHFLSAAREVSYSKPIIVLKAGRTQEGAWAALYHTGAQMGEDAVFDAAFRRSGILRVDTLQEVFLMAEVIAKQPRPKGKNLAILTNGGGLGVLATDALLKGGGQLAELSESSRESLHQILPHCWEIHNPIDLLGKGTPQNYEKVLEVIAQDTQVDGILVILSPQVNTDPTETAERIAKFAKIKDKPILASWVGSVEVEKGREILAQVGIPHLPYPDSAAAIFNYLWRYAYNLKGIYQTPRRTETPHAFAGEQVEQIIFQAQKEKRTRLSKWESLQILKAYGLPVIETQLAHSPEEACQKALAIGKPIALKAHVLDGSSNVLSGGLRLYLKQPEEVSKAYQDIQKNVEERRGADKFEGVMVQEMSRIQGIELAVGMQIDSQFGRVIVFGNGEKTAQYYPDRAIALPPLNTTLARRAMEQTRIYQTLEKAARLDVDTIANLEQLLVRFSELVVEQPWISGIKIDPIAVSAADGMAILDANISLFPADTPQDELPTLAIRPYPESYEMAWRLKKSQLAVQIRPIRPEDQPLMEVFHSRLSTKSVYFRFFHNVSLDQRISHERLSRLCFADYERQITLVCETALPNQNGELEPLVIGAARCVRFSGTQEAEFAMSIIDDYQGEGLGTVFLSQIVEICKREKIEILHADILPENIAMKKVCEKLGFEMRLDMAEGAVKATLYVESQGRESLFEWEDED